MTQIIHVVEVTKRYYLYPHRHTGIMDFLLHLPRHIESYRKRTPFYALQKVTFSVEAGETIGIIGPNGSGKTTLLSLLAGIIKQDAGRIFVRGAISSILDLGSGFHPELTGRENAWMNGILLGLTRLEARQRLDAIFDFSELGPFIDQPLKTYSSGMVARLGFSVAIHVDPSILFIDEILAVGDMAFQQKCFQKIDEFKRRGITTLFVSHDPGTIIRLCDRALLLHQGRQVAFGSPAEVADQYKNLLSVSLPAIGS